MLQWLWEFGHSIGLPQLDPQKMSALLLGNNHADKESCLREGNNARKFPREDYTCSDNDDFYGWLEQSRRFLAEGVRIDMVIWSLLLAFRYFKPHSYPDDPEEGYEKWYIEFSVWILLALDTNANR